MPGDRFSLKPHAIWVLILALLVLLVLGGSLFTDHRILSDKNSDIALQYFHSRFFAFEEISKGNLPLWNPYIYGGVPFLGDLQSALLYPPNLIFLVAPIGVALNWSIALHLFILGVSMYAWAIWRGLHRSAAFIAAVTIMLGGPFFLHIFAGHLSNICTLAWTPLIFLGIDAWLARRHAGWLFLSAAAAALQIYAGHPQYVYYTAIVAGIYSLTFLVSARRTLSAALGLIAIYPLAALLSAAQLIPGFSAAAESVRSSGLSYDYASMFPFPPENLLTLLSPWLLGNMQDIPYWGRWFLWETSLYSGIGALILSVHGFLRFRQSDRVRFLIILGAVFLLALGKYTPVYHLTYSLIPGFNTFRGTSKFIFFIGLFISLFAGIGFDRLLRLEFPNRYFTRTGIVIGGGLLSIGFYLAQKTSAAWASFCLPLMQSKENFLLLAGTVNSQKIIALAQALSAHSLEISGILILIYISLLVTANRRRSIIWILGAVCVIDLFLFAKASVVTFEKNDATYPVAAKFLAQNPGDYRVLNLLNPDAGITLRAESLWGYDPSVLKRYAEFLYFTQGLNPNKANQYLQFTQSHPLYSLLRARYILDEKGIRDMPNAEPLTRFFVVSRYNVIPDRDAVFAAIDRPEFEPSNEIILEKEPFPKPDNLPAKTSVTILNSSTDHWTLEVNSEHPVILVMTDTYSKDWHATALPGSTQTHYDLLPADYVLRAIPLAAGHHMLRIEYTPAGFHAGIILTLITLTAMAGSLLFSPLRKRLVFI
ncbi:MAG: hypothetical protein ABI615_03580 [Chthoniobacterales bacterium]